MKSERHMCTEKYSLQLNSVPNIKTNLTTAYQFRPDKTEPYLGLDELKLHCIRYSSNCTS